MNDHPCDTCLRWPECNGIDQDTCQLVKAYTERENAPTKMADFLASRLQVPLVHISAEDLAKAMEPRRPDPRPNTIIRRILTCT